MSVAVVIPLFNHARYIGAALGSVFEQTRPADQIVIVDDGSKDDSVAVAREVGGARITLVAQENAGAHVALNRAIEMATTEHVAILNSDDIYHPRRLEACLDHLERNPEHAAVCTALKLIDSDGGDLAADSPKARWAQTVWDARREDAAEWLGVANFAKTSSNFVGRTAVFRAHPFRPYRYVHDYFFALQLALHGQLGVVSDELLSYRTHPQNTIKANGLEKVTREVLRMNFDLLREGALSLQNDPAVRARYTRYFRELIQNHADFRAEVFLAAIARALPEDVSIPPLPELSEKSSGVLKRQRAAADAQAAKAKVLRESKWLQLGRKLGFIPRGFEP